MRWTRDPPDLNWSTCFKSDLSEIISAVDLTSYNGWDRAWSVDLSKHHDRWIKIQRRINDVSFQIKTKGIISALHQWSDAHDTIATILSMDSWSRLSIAMHLLIQRLRPIFRYLNSVLRGERTCLWIFAKFSFCRPPIRMPFVSLYSWCISAATEPFNSKFNRKRKENSHLELQIFHLRKLGMKNHASGD